MFVEGIPSSPLYFFFEWSMKYVSSLKEKEMQTFCWKKIKTYRTNQKFQ